jgi:type IV secretory pathway VirB3-like protein
MNEDNRQISQEQKKKLKGVRGFATRDEHFGIPHRLCISILLLAGFWGGVVLKSPLAVFVWIIVLAVPMRYIHKNDPQGFQVWCRAVFSSPKRWSAAKVGRRKLHIISKEDL